MDIEGHEDYCLEGGRQTIAAHRPTLLMEVNKPYYEARGVRLDERLLPLLPENYVIFREIGGRWTRSGSLDACSQIDNVFLVPVERLGSPRYSMFNA